MALYSTDSTSSHAEINPRPRRKATQTLSISYWNLNIISAYNVSKIHLFRVYASIQKFDLIYLSETYRDSSIDDEGLEISWYYLICSDYPSNRKCGVICVYYKNLFTFKVSHVCLLAECVTFDFKLGNILYSLIALYRSFSQSQDGFTIFPDNFELILDLVSRKSILTVAFGDFSANLTQWNGKNSSTSEGISIEIVASRCGLHQIINEPTHK